MEGKYFSPVDYAGVVREINHRFAVGARLALLRARSRRRPTLVVGELAIGLALFLSVRAGSLRFESLEVELLHLLEFDLVLMTARGPSRIVTYLVH